MLLISLFRRFRLWCFTEIGVWLRLTWSTDSLVFVGKFHSITIYLLPPVQLLAQYTPDRVHAGNGGAVRRCRNWTAQKCSSVHYLPPLLRFVGSNVFVFSGSSIPGWICALAFIAFPFAFCCCRFHPGCCVADRLCVLRRARNQCQFKSTKLTSHYLDMILHWQIHWSPEELLKDQIMKR